MSRIHPPQTSLRWWLTVGIAISVLLVGMLAIQARSRSMPARQSMVLLIPDSSVLTHPVTRAWLNASQEEGLALTTMTANEFIRAQANHQPIPGVLLPDTVHQQASDILVNTLTQYVERGGHLLVSFDAAVRKPPSNNYAEGASRLSHLVGLRYALYAQLQDRTLSESPIFGNREAEQILSIQPGKFDFADDAPGAWAELTTYGYEHLVYGHFRTEALSPITTLLRASDGDPVVSTHVYGLGQVLFANLPLGYLKTRTDGYLLHRLLGYFSHDIVGLPNLSAAPQAQGGIVLNMHVDSNAAQTPLAELEKIGWFNDGPYSIHVTAGPDSTTQGDGLGLNLQHNPWMQAFLRRQHARGHEIGNHGGWTHNMFGILVDEKNASAFEPFIELNHASVSTTIGELATTYSAPMGNQPSWATAWLQKKGFKGYYSTSDNGLGPTRSFTNGQEAPSSGLWTFPISNFKRIATFDEIDDEGMQEEDISAFIRQLFMHVSQNHVVRLFYFHPTATANFMQSLESLQIVAKSLQLSDRFRWYTMADLSDFMNRRQDVQWEIRDLHAQRLREISAHSSTTLKDMSWVIPARGAQDIRITKGEASLRREKGQWFVVAGDSPSLQVQWTPLP